MWHYLTDYLMYIFGETQPTQPGVVLQFYPNPNTFINLSVLITALVNGYFTVKNKGEIKRIRLETIPIAMNATPPPPGKHAESEST